MTERERRIRNLLMWLPQMNEKQLAILEGTARGIIEETGEQAPVDPGTMEFIITKLYEATPEQRRKMVIVASNICHRG